MARKEFTEYQKRMPEGYVRENETQEEAKQRWEQNVKKIEQYFENNYVDRDDPKSWPRFFTLQTKIAEGEKYTDSWEPQRKDELGDFSFTEGLKTMYEGDQFNPYALSRALFEASQKNEDLLFYANEEDDIPRVITQRSEEEIAQDIYNNDNISVQLKTATVASAKVPWKFTQFLYDHFGWFAKRVEPYYKEKGIIAAENRMQSERAAQLEAENAPEPDVDLRRTNDSLHLEPKIEGREEEKKEEQEDPFKFEEQISTSKKKKRNRQAEPNYTFTYDEENNIYHNNELNIDVPAEALQDENGKMLEGKELSIAFKNVRDNIKSAKDDAVVEKLIAENQKRYFGSHPDAHPSNRAQVKDRLNNNIIELPENTTEEEFITTAMCAHSDMRVVDLHTENKLFEGALQINPYPRDEMPEFLDPKKKLKPLSQDILDDARLGRAHVDMDMLLTADKITSPGRVHVAHMDCFNMARDLSKQAWENYANGDKTELVNLLRTGLRYHTKAMSIEPSINRSIYINNAMTLNQIAGILEKHPDLLEAISENPTDRALLGKVVASKNVLDIVHDGYKAQYKLMNEKNLTKEQREKYAQRYIAMHLLNEENLHDVSEFEKTPMHIQGSEYCQYGRTMALTEYVNGTRPLAPNIAKMSTKAGSEEVRKNLYERAKNLDIYDKIVKDGSPLFKMTQPAQKSYFANKLKAELNNRQPVQENPQAQRPVRSGESVQKEQPGIAK